MDKDTQADTDTSKVFRLLPEDERYPGLAGVRLLGVMLFPADHRKANAFVRGWEAMAFDRTMGTAKEDDHTVASGRILDVLKLTAPAAMWLSEAEIESAKRKGLFAGVMLYAALTEKVHCEEKFSMTRARRYARRWGQLPGQKPPSEKLMRDAWASHAGVAHFWAAFGPDPWSPVKLSTDKAAYGHYLARAEAFRILGESTELLSTNGGNYRLLDVGRTVKVVGLTKQKLTEGMDGLEVQIATMTEEQRAMFAPSAWG